MTMAMRTETAGRPGHAACGRSDQPEAHDPFPSVGRDRRLQGGETLFLDDDPAEDVHRVTEGVVRLCKLLPDGRRAVVGFRYPGELVGLCAGRRHQTSAETVTPATVRSYSRAALEQAVERSSDLRGSLSAVLWRELEAAQASLVLLGRMSAVERVAHFLVALSRRERNASRLALPMTRLDMADHLGVTIETVSRTLMRLKREGLIALPSPHDLVILRPAALRALAGEEAEASCAA